MHRGVLMAAVALVKKGIAEGKTVEQLIGATIIKKRRSTTESGIPPSREEAGAN